MEAVDEVGFGSVLVQVEEKNIQTRVKVLEPFFDALGDDLVGNAAKGLQAEDVVDMVFHEHHHFSGN